MIRALSETQFIGSMSLKERMEKIWEPFIKHCDKAENKGCPACISGKKHTIESMRVAIKERIDELEDLIWNGFIGHELELGTLQYKLERLGG